ncbi:hypothetical protein BGW37DRAFT_517733 [Umbelopsis sp. PMI_123]|nr:hypothetical protein BGW37DRAFT_517733 [Umbelopsis sp. PMI_123]
MTEKVSYLAYADDVLVVINDFWELPKVLEIYDEYAAGSNTRLNVSKTEGITMYGSSDLWRERFSTIKWFDEMSDFCPMYLGYPLTTSKTHMKQALTNITCDEKQASELGVIDVEAQAAALTAHTLTSLLHRQHYNRSFAHDFIEGILRQLFKIDSIAIMLMEPAVFTNKLKTFPFLRRLIQNFAHITSFPEDLANYYASILCHVPISRIVVREDVLGPIMRAKSVSHFLPCNEGIGWSLTKTMTTWRKEPDDNVPLQATDKMHQMLKTADSDRPFKLSASPCGAISGRLTSLTALALYGSDYYMISSHSINGLLYNIPLLCALSARNP